MRIATLLVLVLTGCATGAYAPSSDSNRPGLGTTWGETRQSQVRWVSFEREDGPLAEARIYYDDRQGLAALTGETPTRRWPGTLAGGRLAVRIVDAGGSPLPVVTWGARQFVEGRQGQRYSIVLENVSDARIEAVTTVDGLDVMDGQRGDPGKRGYILRPGGSVRIDGFRRSMDEVAAFRFGTVAESYAAARGDDRNVGVIGVAFFAERGFSRGRLDAQPFAQPPGY